MSSELPPTERPPRRPSRLSGPALGGAILILLGIYFLFQTFGLLNFFRFLPGNMWSLLLLIPAGLLAYNAWQVYQANEQQLNREARSKAIGAGVLVILFLMSFWNLDWGKVWPVFLIMGGLAVLFGAIGSRHE